MVSSSSEWIYSMRYSIICTWALLSASSSAGKLFHVFLLHISSRAHVLNLCYKFVISVIRLFKSLFSVFPQNIPVDHEVLLSIYTLSNLQNLPSSIFSNYPWNSPSSILNLSLPLLSISICLTLSVYLFVSQCPSVLFSPPVLVVYLWFQPLELNQGLNFKAQAGDMHLFNILPAPSVLETVLLL